MAIYKPKRKINSNGATDDVKFPASCIEGLDEITGLKASAATSAATNVLMEEGNKLVYKPLSEIKTNAGKVKLTGDASGEANFDSTGVATISVAVADDSHNHTISNVDGLQTALNGKANADSVVKLSGGTMNDGASLKFSTYGTRSVTITGNSIGADMSKETGGWAGNFASVKDPAGDTTAMLGWYGGASGLTHIYMGGSYSDPYMKMTKAGEFTFKNTPKVGSTSLALATNATTSTAGLMSAADKTKLDTLASYLTNNHDDYVDSLAEIMAIFDTYPQGASVVQALSEKVDKVSGKGLSTNDFTAAYKSKLDGIASGANNYSLPTASSSVLGGVKTGSNITNTSGTISLTKENVTSALGYTPPNGSFVPLSGGTMTGTLGMAAKKNSLYWTSASASQGYYAYSHYNDSADEGLVFGTGNNKVSFVFRNDGKTSWSDAGAALQIKNNTVAVNKTITGSAASYNLDVNGTANATTLYEGGTSLANKYQAKGTYAGTSIATQNANGLMSATDKYRLDTLSSYLMNGHDDYVDSLAEVMAIFEKYPQGASIVDALSDKVDKVSGKGLSTNDFTAAYKTKVDNAVTVGDTQTVSGNKTFTGQQTFTSDKFSLYVAGDNKNDSWFKFTDDGSTYYAFGIRRPYDSYGFQIKKHTTSGDSYYDIYHQGNYTKMPAATTSAAGLMSSSDKSKLDGIASGANAYSHPTTSGNKHIPTGGSSGQILRWSSDGTAVWGDDNNTTYSNATQSAAGLMSAADKTKVDNAVTLSDAQTISGTKTFSSHIKTAENVMGTKYRTHDSYETGVVYGTSGNEALTFAIQNPVTAFQIVYGTKPSAYASGTWQSVTPLFQTKDGKVIINRKIASSTDSANLKLFDVNGDANATTLYENGTALSNKYQAKGNYAGTAVATTGAAGLMSATDKSKLDGIASGANAYSLPLAASGTRGGIKIGYTASGANLPVALSSEKAYVALTKSAVTSALGYTPLSTGGGTLSGTITLTSGDVVAPYLAATSAGHETGTYDKVATLSSTGYIRYRTKAELKADLGVPSFSYSSGRLVITRG